MRNSEYYTDPTAGEALKNVKRDVKKSEQKALEKAVRVCKKNFEAVWIYSCWKNEAARRKERENI